MNVDQPPAVTLEAVELALARDLVGAAPPELAGRLGLAYRRHDRAGALVATRADAPMINRVLGLGLLAPADPAAIDALTAPWRDAAVRYLVQVVPEAETPALRAGLEARGLRRLDAWAKVWRGTEPAPEVATDLRVDEVGPERADDFARILCAAFGMPTELGGLFVGLPGRPGWHVYLGFDGEQAIATGAMFVEGGTGSVVFGATLPTHRRRGAQGAIMARRIRDGLGLGCRLFVAEAEEDRPDHPNPSYHNMLRTGFRLAYLRRNYVHFPPGMEPS